MKTGDFRSTAELEIFGRKTMVRTTLAAPALTMRELRLIYFYREGELLSRGTIFNIVSDAEAKLRELLKEVA